MGGIRIRPHHLLCIQGFRGQGYSPTFIANMARLQEMFAAEPGASVAIVDGVDDICSCCPHRDGSGCSRPGQRVEELDQRTRERLRLPAGAAGPWSTFVDAICDNIDGAGLTEVCAGCNWLDLGFCAAGIDRLCAERDRR